MLPVESNSSALDLCPLHAEGVELHDSNLHGSVAVLKNPAHWTYFKLSSIGYSIWNKMDGAHSIRSIIADMQSEFPEAPSNTVIQVLGQLRRSGFMQFKPTSLPINADRFLLSIRHPLIWDLSLRKCDFAFDFLYRRVGKVMFTGFFLLLAMVCGTLGLLTFLRDATIIRLPADYAHFFCFASTTICTVLLHECAHGLAVKHFGRTVGSVGFGWFWFGPAFFVDTSDMWLSSRSRRIAVSLAGPAVEFLLAGAAAIAAQTLHTNISLSCWLWTFSAISYYRLLFNLCPLLEYDGYFVLCDLLQQPNLRRRACQLLRSRGLGSWRGSTSDRMLFIYYVASILYTLLLAFTTARYLKREAEYWAQKILSFEASITVSNLIFVMFFVLVVAAVLFDLFKKEKGTFVVSS
jgi:putative peptide zinc metalloprotease protein